MNVVRKKKMMKERMVMSKIAVLVERVCDLSRCDADSHGSAFIAVVGHSVKMT